MTIGEIDTKITSLVKVDQTQYSAALRLIDVNIWLYRVQSMIFNSMDEVDFDDKNYADYPEVTVPMVAGQRDYTVPLSEKVVSFKRVDMSYNGQDYYRGNPIDAGEIYSGLGPASATAQNLKVDSLFAKTAPRYDPAYNSVRIYPAPTASDVASGGKVFIAWVRELVPFTSGEYVAGTKIPGFDTEFHPLLCYGAAFEFFSSTGQNTNAANMKAAIAELEGRLIQTYGKKELDRTNTLVPLYSSFK